MSVEKASILFSNISYIYIMAFYTNTCKNVCAFNRQPLTLIRIIVTSVNVCFNLFTLLSQRLLLQIYDLLSMLLVDPAQNFDFTQRYRHFLII